mgnify:CR=1 FL=1
MRLIEERLDFRIVMEHSEVEVSSDNLRVRRDCWRDRSDNLNRMRAEHRNKVPEFGVEHYSSELRCNSGIGTDASVLHRRIQQEFGRIKAFSQLLQHAAYFR